MESVHVHRTGIRRRLLGVLNEMYENVLQPFRVRFHDQALIDTIHGRLRRISAARRNGFRNHLANVDHPGAGCLQPSFPQMLQKSTHLPGGVRNGVNRIAHEGRILEMPLRVLNHQVELRHEVLQIMHDVGRQPIEGIKLTRVTQRRGKAKQREVAGRLLACGLEKIGILPVEPAMQPRWLEPEYPDQLTLVHDRHDDPGTSLGLK